MGCWAFARVLDHRIEGRVGQGRKIVRLPVVTEARGEQGIKGALPHDIGLGAYVFAEDLREVPNGGNQFLALGRISSIEDSEHDDFFSVDFGGQKWQGWSLSQHYPNVQVIWNIFNELTVLLQDRLGLVERENNQSAEHSGSNQMQLKLEGGDNAKVPTTTSDAPEQVGILTGTCSDQLSVGCHHVRRYEVV